MANKFKEIKTLAELLDKLNGYIEEQVRDIKNDYCPIGEEQVKKWDGTLLWEDEEKTVPKMTSVWGYVPKEEISEGDESYITTWRKIQAHLEKML